MKIGLKIFISLVEVKKVPINVGGRRGHMPEGGETAFPPDRSKIKIPCCLLTKWDAQHKYIGYWYTYFTKLIGVNQWWGLGVISD